MGLVTGTQYATRTDLANLGMVGAALSAIPTGTQDAALAAASALADSKLQSRYVLPLTSWGQDLVRAVAIIAAYDLLTSRGYNPMAGADQNIRQRYLDQLAWLDNVGKGTDTPAYAVDSSKPDDGSTDGSDVTGTAGGFQMTTTQPRGWTDRGASNIPDEGL